VLSECRALSASFNEEKFDMRVQMDRTPRESESPDKADAEFSLIGPKNLNETEASGMAKAAAVTFPLTSRARRDSVGHRFGFF